MSARHPGGQWVNGCTNPADPHEIGQCDGPPTYEGNAPDRGEEVRDAVALTELAAELETSLPNGGDPHEVAGLVLASDWLAVRTSAAVKQAQADAWDEGTRAAYKARMVQGESLPPNPYRGGDL